MVRLRGWGYLQECFPRHAPEGPQRSEAPDRRSQMLPGMVLWPLEVCIFWDLSKGNVMRFDQTVKFEQFAGRKRVLQRLGQNCHMSEPGCPDGASLALGGKTRPYEVLRVEGKVHGLIPNQVEVHRVLRLACGLGDELRDTLTSSKFESADVGVELVPRVLDSRTLHQRGYSKQGRGYEPLSRAEREREKERERRGEERERAVFKPCWA